MYGADIGSLNVYSQLVTSNLKNVTSRLVWTKSGTQGSDWRRAVQTLYNLNATDTYGWRVAFEGVVGKSYLGDIALDDILLSQSACPPSRGCDFELNLCDYQTNGWVRQQATNISYFVNQDHTSGTSQGYFARASENNAK